MRTQRAGAPTEPAPLPRPPDKRSATPYPGGTGTPRHSRRKLPAPPPTTAHNPAPSDTRTPSPTGPITADTHTPDSSRSPHAPRPTTPSRNTLRPPLMRPRAATGLEFPRFPPPNDFHPQNNNNRHARLDRASLQRFR